jgi:hypothetical protein
MGPGGDDLVDAHEGIDPRSLRIDSRRVTWRRGARLHSYALDRPRPCSFWGSSTLDRSSEVRVYWLRGRVYGCVNASGKRTMIGQRAVEQDEYSGGDHIHAAGHFASIDQGYRTHYNGGGADFQVWDLTTGTIVHRWACDGCIVVTSLLAPNGGVAWVSATGRAQLLKSDAEGEAIVLAAPANGGTDFLSLRGTTLTWKSDGLWRIATLR